MMRVLILAALLPAAASASPATMMPILPGLPIAEPAGPAVPPCGTTPTCADAA